MKKRKSNLLKEVEARNFFRQQYKKLLDGTIDLSVKKTDKDEVFYLQSITPNNEFVRLLDEGSVLYGDGSVRAYIKKGVLEDFYNSLDDDYVGVINIGHFPYAEFPFPVGAWSKEDLRLVDIGDGRKGLDARMAIDEESIFIKELRRQHNTIGISAEFSYSIDDTVDEELLERLDWAPVIDKLTIHDFGIIGEPGNCNSTMVLNSENKEDNMKDGIVKKLYDKYFSKTEPEPHTTDPALEPEPVVVESVAEPEPNPTPEPEVTPAAEPAQTEPDPVQVEPDSVDEKIKDLETIVLGLKKENEELAAENERLKASDAKSKEELSATSKRVSAVLEKFGKLGVVDSQGNVASSATQKNNDDEYDPLKFIAGE
ncbi:hypothetical protein ACYSNR_00930 [Enterococcus sp. LJL128]